MEPIETAPRDGTPVQARIPGHGSDNIIAYQYGLVDDNGGDCGGWMCMGEQEPPDCWTDGVCWAENADGMPSVQPTHWKPLTRLCHFQGEGSAKILTIGE